MGWDEVVFVLVLSLVACVLLKWLAAARRRY